MANKIIKILSLGAGVQSTTLLLMSIRGELPKVDCAIFADTQAEPKGVYEHLFWLEQQAIAAGIPVHRVTRGNLRVDSVEFRRNRVSAGVKQGGKRYASIPLFVLNPDGSKGMIRRQCTSEYKIEPITRFIRKDILGLLPKQRAPRTHAVDHWFGITWDERQRMRKASHLWEHHVYPFCNFSWDKNKRTTQTYFDQQWVRHHCAVWLRKYYPDRRIVRSACTFCPYRNNEEWRMMKANDPESWADAVKLDKEIREANSEGQSKRKLLVGLPFVHRDCVPLDEVDLGPEKDKLHWDGIADNECTGMCGN